MMNDTLKCKVCAINNKHFVHVCLSSNYPLICLIAWLTFNMTHAINDKCKMHADAYIHIKLLILHINYPLHLCQSAHKARIAENSFSKIIFSTTRTFEF